jgi:hypothetical protein
MTPGADTTVKRARRRRYLPERIAAGLVCVSGPGPETVCPDGRHEASCAPLGID